MRAALYERVSAAHFPEPVEAGLETLRRHAETNGWEVVAEHSDAAPSLRVRRYGLEALAAMVRKGQVDVVVVRKLSRLARSVKHLAQLGHTLAEAKVRLVAVEEGFDTALPPWSLGWSHLMARLDAVRGALQSEATVCGLASSALRAPGRAPAAVNVLEVRALYERPHRGRMLSQADIVRVIRSRGGTMSKGMLSRILRELRESGDLDEAARQAGIEKHRFRRRGGRPKSDAVADLDAVAALWAGGHSRQAIANKARKKGRLTPSIVDRLVRELRAAGRIDDDARAAAQARRKSSRRRPRRA